jgi:transposase
MSKMTLVKREGIISSYRQGTSIPRIASQYGFSKGYMHRYLSRAGVHKIRKDLLTEIEKKFIETSVKKGLNFKQIGEAMGRPYYIPRNYAKREGLFTPIKRVHSLKKFIDPWVLKKIQTDYESLKYTGIELGKKYGVSKPSIVRLARKHKWKGRKSPDNPTRIAADRLIRKWYKLHELSTLQIARKLRNYPWASEEYVRRRLIDSGVKLRSKGHKNPLEEFYQYKHLGQTNIKNKDIIRFIKENHDRMNLKEMAAALGIDRNTIQRRAIALGFRIERRPQRTIEKYDRIIFEYKKNPTLSIDNLSKKFRVSPSTISNYFKKHRIKLKGHQIKTFRFQQKIKLLRPEIIIDYASGHTMNTISKKYHINQPIVKQILLKEGFILRRRRK